MVRFPPTSPPAFRSQSLVITDLDETLRPRNGWFHPVDIQALVRLGASGVTRSLATGRSMYSYRRGIPDGLPLDFIIFSSGAGVWEADSGRTILSRSLEGPQAARAASVLKAFGLDFMIHDPVPNNHRFRFFKQETQNPDFDRRIDLYAGFVAPLHEPLDSLGPAAQLLAVVPPGPSAPLAFLEVQKALGDLSVIRTTSPLDGASVWIEIFPKNVSKGQTAAWLAQRLGVDRSATMGIGNDFNDEDLLAWVGQAYVVGNAPEELKRRFPSVASCREGGVAEAVDRWLAERHAPRSPQ